MPKWIILHKEFLCAPILIFLRHTHIIICAPCALYNSFFLAYCHLQIWNSFWICWNFDTFRCLQYRMGSNSLNKVRIGSLAWIKKFEIYRNGSVEVAWSLKSSAIAKLLKTWNNMFVEERRLEFYFQILPSNFSSLLWVDFGLLMNLFVQM